MLRVSTQRRCRAPFAVTAEMVQQYRRQGYLAIPPEACCLGPSTLDDLKATCTATVIARGAHSVPVQDEAFRQRVEVTTTLANPPTETGRSPSTGSTLVSEDSGDPSGGASAFQVAQDASYKKKLLKMKLRFRNKRDVDKAYDKVTAARRIAMQEGRMSVATASKIEALERASEACDPSEIDVEAASRAFDKGQAIQEFEAYRQSGHLERDIRKQQHIDDVYAYVDNAVQSWTHTWSGSDALRRLLIGEASPIGARLGDIGGSLSGSVVMRLYDDCILRLPMLCNSIPVHFHGAFTSYRDPRGLDALIALPFQQQRHPGTSVVVYPGSHHAIADLTAQGHDLQAFQKVTLWDIGEVVRPYPTLRRIEPVVVPMAPGTILLANNLLMRTCLPTMAGRVSGGPMPSMKQLPHTPHAVDECPLLYMVQLMPDGSTFDGSRLTWMSKDSHGPLYKYSKGDKIRDKDAFPILHNELDLE